MNSPDTPRAHRPTLVTGFERFDPWPINPSEQIIRHLAANAPATRSAELICEVLPTEYRRAGEQIGSLIAEHDPGIVLMLGLAGSRERICLERFALNIDDVSKPDNAARILSGSPIDPDGPAAFKTKVSLDPIVAELTAHGIDARTSNHAGTYVCNHVFYEALKNVAARGNQAGCLFVHLPMSRDGLTPEQAEPYRWHLNEMIQAVELIIRQLETQRADLADAL